MSNNCYEMEIVFELWIIGTKKINNLLPKTIKVEKIFILKNIFVTKAYIKFKINQTLNQNYLMYAIVL